MNNKIVFCVKLKKNLPGMKFQPLPNDLGKKIYENISQEAWDSWIKFQTMLINEHRLNLADANARKFIAQQMEIYFFSE